MRGFDPPITLWLKAFDGRKKSAAIQAKPVSGEKLSQRGVLCPHTA
jgi:hypothetical protein